MESLGGPERLRGFNACFYGVLPTSAGLSSSSSLVVATGMTALASAGLEIDPVELAGAMARAEQFTGIDCGEMDQAVSLLGAKGKLLKIDFFPLRIEAAALPPGYTVVVANSMVEAAKTLGAKTAYNTRHTVCKLATALLCKRLELDGVKFKRLGDLYQELGQERLLDELKRHFKWHGYTPLGTGDRAGDHPGRVREPLRQNRGRRADTGT